MPDIFFPQLTSGCVAQYPLRKQRRLRTVTNVLPGGELILLPDENFSSLTWTLNFSGINTQDANLLRAHFEACSGPLLPFTFADPTDNLLTFSSNLSDSVWQRPNLLQIGTQTLDPFGSFRAFTVTNSSQALQEFVQTVPIPSFYSQCFSLYAKSINSTSLELLRRGISAAETISVNLTPDWTRFQFVGSLGDGSFQTSVGFGVRPGDQVEIFGPQLELQSFPSAYSATAGTSGLYTSAFLTDQQFNLIAQAPNAYTVTLTIQASL